MWRALVSTFVMTPWLDIGRLTAATASNLSTSKYTQAFIHAVLGPEEQALYRWQRGTHWSQSTLPISSQDQGRSFWDYKRDADLLPNPDGWCDLLSEKRACDENANINFSG